MTRPFERLTIEQVATLPRPGTVAPAAIRFSPRNTAILYLQNIEGTIVRALWSYDIATGARTILAGPPPDAGEAGLSLEEQLRRERARLREVGVTDYSFAKHAPTPTLLLPLDGRLHVALGDSPPRPLPGTEGALDAHLSPDGATVAFTRADELWVVPTAGGEPRRLTHTAEPGLTNAVADFLAAEELDRHEGYWWSPDSSRIAFVEADSRHVPIYPIVHQGRDTVQVEEHRYPFAGQPNPTFRLGVLPATGGDPLWMDLQLAPGDYLARVAWRPDGTLAALTLDRAQATARWLTFDRESGAATALIEETTHPWFNLSNDTRFLHSGEVLLSSERDGFRHLHLHAPDGSPLRALTAGPWVVTRLVAVDEDARVAYFLATRDSVLERHLYAVPLDGGEPQRLTHDPGWHDVTIAHDHSRFVDTWSSLHHGPRVALRDIHGALQATIFDNPGATAEDLGLDPPRFVEVEAEDGTILHGALYTPPLPSPSSLLPLVLAVYGGPHAQTVADQWALTVDLRAQHLAQQGFLVLKLDNRGMANRGLAFEAHIHRDMGNVEVQDQVTGVQALIDAGLADPARVGVYGWSYGGYMACLCLLKAPAVFRAAVAGAPVTAWDGYDTAYTERYMSTPEENPAGYAASSVLRHVANLQGKLLIIHGMVDENVHFRHTARLTAALAAAQKPYDAILYAEERHMPRDQPGLEYQERRVFEYLRDNLG